MDDVMFRLAVSATDAARLDEIRQAAFEPVFASFRALLGDEIYEIAQAKDDRRQGELLTSLLAAGSGWDVFVAERAHRVVGFVAVRVDLETGIGEIGLNAVDPAHAGHGLGTAMYEHALAHLKRAGAKVAMVGTGGDASHQPARRAYEKVGFHASLPTVWMYRRL